MNSKKRIAVITGASSGFGKIFAAELEKMIDLEEIWLVARREERLKETAAALERVKGVVIKADLSRPKEIERIVQKAADEDVSVKVLVNNAGFGKSGEFIKGDSKYYSDMIDVNIKAPVLLSKGLLDNMEEGAKILNISSLAAFSPLPYFAVYASSKSFLLNFSYALNQELRSKDIAVTCVCPGPASTEFFKTKSKKVNGLKMQDPAKIVKKALKDMKKNKDISLFGFQTKYLRLISKFLPRSVLAWAGAKVKFPK